ncbi:YggT family protein [Gordonia sp. w5E2]|uniref:Membrane protein n=1 Tax=Gordonia jacobaea TaxID=122202 RepID=A0ABR5IDZ2_9ACTN|nr:MULTISPECIES: YggT family protein [Gordonia]KNA91889.1 membrane protein [Gordonia jacobaea]SKY35847.1 transmembrane protein [Mycobacteroides abscessus subsp. abscessus]
MAILFEVLYYVLFIYWLLLLARLVIELVRTFAREWRPTGIAVVIIEAVFTVTDPPIKALRRVLPPIPLGPVRLDLSLMIVMIVVLILMSVMRGLANSAASDALASGLI